MFLLFLRNLIIENFVPLADVEKVKKRAAFDEDEEVWKLAPLTQVTTYVRLLRCWFRTVINSSVISETPIVKLCV